MLINWLCAVMCGFQALRSQPNYRQTYSVADRLQWVEAARRRFQSCTAARRGRTSPASRLELDGRAPPLLW